jgi:predicted KAP-like P-loop ATPase
MNSSTIDPDRPLDDPAKDLMGYAAFSKQLAKSIVEMKPEQGLVMAIYGPWGSGKTTLLNFIEYYLSKEPYEKLPFIINFNPWLFSSREDLILNFFTELDIVLKNNNAWELADNLTSYGDSFIKTASLVDYTAFLSKIGLDFLRKFIKKRTSIDEKRKRLESALRSESRKILVVIDDLDRLNAEEIRQIFSLLKSVCNFPNIIYVLAFDEKVVTESLKQVQNFSGREYLKKIVQIPFELPQPEKIQLISLLCQQLDKILINSFEKFDRERWNPILNHGISYYLHTLRDVIIFTNSITVTYPCVQNESNPVDFLAIEVLRIFAQDVYHFIRENPQIFTGFKTEAREVKNPIDIIFKDKSEEECTALKCILKNLFPKLKQIEYGSEAMSIWRKQERVCCPEYFSRYFRLVLPQGSISNRDMQNALNLLPDNIALGKLFAGLILEDGINGHTRLAGFLEKLETLDKSNLSKETIIGMISAFFEAGDSLLLESDEKKSRFDMLNDAYRVRWVLFNLLEQLTKEERLETLRKSFEGCNSIGFSSYILMSLHEEKNDQFVSNTKDEKPILDTPSFQLLSELVFSKIEAIKDTQLINTPKPYLQVVLSLWGLHTTKNEHKKWLKETITNNNHLIDFLKHFVRKTYKITYSLNVVYSFDLGSMKTFIDPKEVFEKITTLPISFKESNSQLLDSFLKAHERMMKGLDPQDPYN